MTAPVKVMTPPSASVTVTVEGLLKSMSPAGTTSSTLRLLKWAGEGAKNCESAACRPLGTPSSTNLSAAGGPAGAGFAVGFAAEAAVLGLPDLLSVGLGWLAATRCTEYAAPEAGLLSMLWILSVGMSSSRVSIQYRGSASTEIPGSTM